MNLWWGGGGVYRGDEQVFGLSEDSPHPPSKENPESKVVSGTTLMYTRQTANYRIKWVLEDE